jgi:predicted RND superfamily exporter protein
MTTLPAEFPEAMLLIALVLSVAIRHVIQMILTVVAAGFVILVVLGLAGYGALTMLTG